MQALFPPNFQGSVSVTYTPGIAPIVRPLSDDEIAMIDVERQNNDIEDRRAREMEDTRHPFLYGLCDSGILEKFIDPEDGHIDGQLLVPFAELPVGTWIYIQVDDNNHHLLHLEYVLPSDLYLIADTDSWYDDPIVQKKDFMI